MARAIPVSATDAAILDTVGGGPIRILGWSVRTGANAMTADLKEGGSGGQILACINLASTGGETAWLGDQGIICNSDVLYMDVAGTTTGFVGTIFIA